MRLPEIAATAGCGLSRIEAFDNRHCPYAIDDIACLRLDLISDCSVSIFQPFFFYFFITKSLKFVSE